MTISLLKNDIINFHWTYQNKSGKVPFEVPNDLVNVNRSDLAKTGNLSDFVTIQTRDQGQLE